MADRTYRRVVLPTLVALVLAHVPALLAPAADAASRTRPRKTARATPGADFVSGKAALAAQEAVPRIEAHLAAGRHAEAALLLDRSRIDLARARARVTQAKSRQALDEARARLEKLAPRVDQARAEAWAALPLGEVLVGPPPPALPLDAGTLPGVRTNGGAQLVAEVAPAPQLPLPGADDDPSYDLPALDDAAIAVESHPLVDKWLDYFTGRGRPTFERWLVRSGQYMGSMKQILEKEGVPTDLVHLVFVESGFNPHARSVAHAVGPWQFIRGTAKLFGLKVNSWVDERKDPEASTIAAARYLKHLHGMFNSWPLALASYNAGEGAVGRAIKRQGTNDFWSLRLPEETRNYVPKFMAVLAISRDPGRYGFDQVAVAEPLEFDEVTIPGPVDLAALAAACGTDVTEIRELNPQFLRGAAPAPDDQVTLRVPEGAGERLMASLADGSLHLPRVATPADPAVLRHKVRRGESLKSLALRYGVPAATIARANRMGKSSRLRVGRTLSIPQGDVVTRSAEPRPAEPRGAANRAAKARTVRVKKGQTLSEIAAAHGVSVDQLKRANALGRASDLKAGQRLKIPFDS